MRRRQFYLAALAVLGVALALRLGPLALSPLPFNPDGVGYAASARDALASGGISLDGTATDRVGFISLLSVVAATAGIEPLYVAQPASALLGAASCLVAVGIARRLGGEFTTPGRARRGAVLAGVLLAIDGLYLYRSMPTDEQTLGLLLVPLVGVAAWRGLDGDDRRWGALAVGLGVAIPPLHNLTGTVGALVVTVVLVAWLVAAPSARRTALAAVGVAVAWTLAIGYHAGLVAVTPARIVQAERVLRAPGLLVGWVILAGAGAAWFRTASRRRRTALVVAVFAGWFAVLGVNAVRAVYPGTTVTPPGLLLALLPLAVPTLLGAAGIARFAGGRTAVAVLALTAGPAGMIGFSLTAGLTPEYLSTLYRAQLFVHLPAMVACGTLVAVALGRRGASDGGTTGEEGGTERDGGTTGEGRRWIPTGVRLPDSSVVRAGVVAVLVACAAASAPVAFAGLELLPYKGATTPAEFAATGFAADETRGFGTDDHLGRVAGYHRGNVVNDSLSGSNPIGAPRRNVLSWLQSGGPPPDGAVLAQRSWTTTGAQAFPRPPIRVAPDRYERWRVRSDVVYVALDGNGDPIELAVPPTNASAGATGERGPDQ